MLGLGLMPHNETRHVSALVDEGRERSFFGHSTIRGQGNDVISKGQSMRGMCRKQYCRSQSSQESSLPKQSREYSVLGLGIDAAETVVNQEEARSGVNCSRQSLE